MQRMPQYSLDNNFAGVPGRTREQRILPQDREAGENARLRERGGVYYNQVQESHMPKPTSSHYMDDQERFNKDFAVHDKVVREQEFRRKQEHMEKRRLANYDRDMKRWEFMDTEESDAGRRLGVQQNKYQLGRKGMGSAAFNILNAQYEENNRGD